MSAPQPAGSPASLKSGSLGCQPAPQRWLGASLEPKPCAGRLKHWAGPAWLPVAVGVALAIVWGLFFYAVSLEEQRTWWLAETVLAAGLLTSGLAATSVYLAQQARRRSRQFQAANFLLQGQIEQRRRLNRSLRALSECNQALVHATGEPRLLQDVCRILVEHCGYLLAWVGYAEDDENKTVRVVAVDGAAKDYMQTGMVSWADIERGRGPTGMAIRTARPAVCHDTLTDANFAPWRERALERGFRSCAALPLLLNSESPVVSSEPGTHNSKLTTHTSMGALSLYAPIPHAFDDQELILLSELAQDLAFGIQTLRTRAGHERAEERLRYLASIVEESEDAIYTKSLDGTIVSWNRGAENIYGYTAAEAIGRNVSCLCPPERADELDGLLRRIPAGDTVRHCETVRLRKDGARLDVSLTLSPLHDRDGQVVGGSSIARDITARKQAEEQLRHSQQKLYLHVQQTPLAVIEWNLNFEVTDWNPRAEALFGYTRADALGRHAGFIVPESERDRMDQAWAGLLAKKDGFRSTNTNLTRQGRVVTCDWYNTPLVDSSGKVIAVASLVEDITERQQAERRLYDQQFYTRSLIEASLDPLMTTDAAGVITDVNQQMELLTGCVRAELIGSEFKHYCTEPERAQQGIRQVLREGKLTDYELTVRSRDHRHTVVAYNATLYRDWEGKIGGVFAAARDITGRKRAEQELHRYTAELARSNADLQDFASIASHDLQEPLRKVLAFGDQLKQHCGAQLDDLGRDFLARMQNAAARMSGLIAALLEYSRVSSRAQPFQPVDLQQVALEVVADLETSIREAHARVTLGTLPQLVADRTQIRQLLQNLLSNAIKFHAPGAAPEVCIDSHAVQDPVIASSPDPVIATEPEPITPSPDHPIARSPASVRCWEIRVRDNGIGFEARYLERIFRPFQRLHARGEYPGSGMGLAICRKIVARHGGAITATSLPGQGATFIVTLPALAEESSTS